MSFKCVPLNTFPLFIDAIKLFTLPHKALQILQQTFYNLGKNNTEQQIHQMANCEINVLVIRITPVERVTWKSVQLNW